MPPSDGAAQVTWLTWDTGEQNPLQASRACQRWHICLRGCQGRTLTTASVQQHRAPDAATRALRAPLLALMISTVTRQGHSSRESRQ